MSFQFFDAGIHEVLRNTLTMAVADNVQPLNFAWRFGKNAIWRTTPTKLREPNKPPFFLAQ